MMKAILKDPGSAITHFVGAVAATAATLPLLFKASHHPGAGRTLSLGIFMGTMILLYAASTTYHSLDISERVNRILRKIDHMAIFLLIAGTYTPVCLCILPQPLGLRLCLLVWGIALAGILMKAVWITCPKWFSSLLYIGMGWVCVLALRELVAVLPPAAFGWLLAGGLIYTAGGILYALKLPLFNARHPAFGSHEIFHLFVMGGSLCHYIMMYQFIA